MSDTSTQVLELDVGGSLDDKLQDATRAASGLGDALDSVEGQAKALRAQLAIAVTFGDKGAVKEITADLRTSAQTASALKAALADVSAPLVAAAQKAEQLAAAEARAAQEATTLAAAMAKEQAAAELKAAATAAKELASAEAAAAKEANALAKVSLAAKAAELKSMQSAANDAAAALRQAQEAYSKNWGEKATEVSSLQKLRDAAKASASAGLTAEEAKWDAKRPSGSTAAEVDELKKTIPDWTSAVKEAAGPFGEAAGPLSACFSTGATAAKGLLAAGAALASAFAVGEALAIDMGSKRELNEKSFEKLGKGAGYAGKIKTEALDLGIDPEKTAEDARKLIAAHLSDKRIDATIHATADVGQLLGADRGEAVKTQIEKLANRDKFDSSSLKGLVKAGLNEDDILVELEGKLHESKKDVLAKIKAGTIDTNTAIDAINASSEKLAGGMAKDAAETVPKLFERLKYDAMSLFDDPKLEGGFKSFLKGVDDVIKGPEGKELKEGVTAVLGAFSSGLLGVDLGKAGGMKEFAHEIAVKLKEAAPAAKEFGAALRAIASAATALLPVISAVSGSIGTIASTGLLGHDAEATAQKQTDAAKADRVKRGESSAGDIAEAAMGPPGTWDVMKAAFKAVIRTSLFGPLGTYAAAKDEEKTIAEAGGAGKNAGGVAVSAANDNAGPAGAAGNMIGVNLGQGITAGIASQTGAVDAAAASLANSAEASARVTSGTHSPSTKWAAMAQDWGAGTVQGLGRSASAVNAAASALAGGAARSAAPPAAGGGRGGNVFHIALAPMPPVNVPPGTSPADTQRHTEAAARGHHDAITRWARDFREAG